MLAKLIALPTFSLPNSAGFRIETCRFGQCSWWSFAGHIADSQPMDGLHMCFHIDRVCRYSVWVNVMHSTGEKRKKYADTHLNCN